MNQTLVPILWVAMALPTLLLIQRWIHRHLHGVSLLAAGKAERAVALYALILLPGVLLHEVSHWLMATFVGVRTGSFSLWPRPQADGSVQLGYVEYYKGRTLGPIRESLIGGAPLLAGTAVILLIGFRVFGVADLTTAVQSGDVNSLATALDSLFQTNDFLVWLYLLFAIGNGMMPSRSDRRAWPAFLLILGGTAVLLAVLGIEKVIFAGVANLAADIFGYLGLALSMIIAVDI
ncbi:MAG: hypothetical protein ACE5EY_11700, partial [Anaerolineae bacterium]